MKNANAKEGAFRIKECECEKRGLFARKNMNGKKGAFRKEESECEISVDPRGVPTVHANQQVPHRTCGNTQWRDYQPQQHSRQGCCCVEYQEHDFLIKIYTKDASLF